MIRSCWTYGDAQWCNLWVITHVFVLDLQHYSLKGLDDRPFDKIDFVQRGLY